MEIPKGIRSIIDRIYESEDRWIAYYNSTWVHAKILEQDYGGKKEWNEPIKYGLPASKTKSHTYASVEHLHRILTTKDGEIAMNYVLTLYSLIESLSFEIHKIITPQKQRIDLSKLKTIEKFLKKRGFLTKEEVNEFRFFKKTRDCIIHHNELPNEDWKSTYSKIKKKKFEYGDDCKLRRIANVPLIEEWNEFIVKITKRIEKYILNLDDKKTL